ASGRPCAPGEETGDQLGRHHGGDRDHGDAHDRGIPRLAAPLHRGTDPGSHQVTTLSVSLEGGQTRPEVGLLRRREGRPGWADGAFWAAILEAWGLPVTRAGKPSLDALAPCTTVVAPALSLDDAAGAQLSSMVKAGTSVLLAGPPSLPALRWLGLEAGDPIPVQGIRLD